MHWRNACELYGVTPCVSKKWKLFNSGVMLLRVHNWSLALLERMLRHGRKQARHRHALAAQAVVRNLCSGCLDASRSVRSRRVGKNALRADGHSVGLPPRCRS